ncbi:hypothetical protein [Nocardia sp. NPDC052566]|uniref:hypothetical protein n=1 Tax=Nocardia sp. NPDC052566 TaxID=3364330 RepID=UPI0037CAD065
MPPPNPVPPPPVAPEPALPPAPAPPPAPAAQPAALELTPAAIGPGGDVTANGKGCDPRAQVDLSIGDVAVGKTVAGQDGAFAAPLTTAAVDVGRHQVTARCGRTLAAPLDVVLVSSVGAGTSTFTVIIFFLLIGGWYYGHRLASHLPARRPE